MSIINAFALLGDQEDDDISALVARAALKAIVVPRPPPPSLKGTGAKFPIKLTDAGIGERDKGRGGHGRGSGRHGLGGNGTEQSVNKHASGYRRSFGRSNGYQQSSGRSNGYQNDNDGVGDNQRNYSGANGYQNDKDGVGGNQRNYSGANGYQRNRGIGNGYGRDSNGYAVDERRHGRSGRERVLNEKHENVGSDQIKIENEQIKRQGKNDDDGWEQVNKHHGKGYGRGIQSFKDGENIFRNGIWSSGGDRRGYVRGNIGFRSREDHFNGTPEGLSQEKKETLNSFEKKGDNSKEGEGDNSGTKEGNYGNSEHEINGNNSGGPEGNATVATEVSNSVEQGQGKISYETGKDSDESKRAAVERQNQMTLCEYEQQLLEKRKNLPPLQTTEGKRVIAEKEFQSMQRIEKKKEDSVFIKLSENDKLKRNGGFDKEEKVNKAISIDEFLKPKGGERRQQPRRRWSEERAGSEQEGIQADSMEAAPPPCIRDQFQFPVLGGGALKL